MSDSPEGRSCVGRWLLGTGVALATVLAGEQMAAARIYNIPATAANFPATAGDGRCGLVEAVNASVSRHVRDACAAGSGNDTIQLETATYTVPVSMEIYGTTLTILGRGMGNTIISSAGVNSPSFPTALNADDCSGRPAAIYITQASLVSFTDLTLRPSSTVDNQGICLSSAETKLTRTRVTGFFSRGIWAGPSPSQGDNAALTLDHSLINFNHAYNDGYGGAGIFFDSGSAQGVFEVGNSTISNNTSEDNGGGAVVMGSAVFNRHLLASTVSNNYAALYGGGLYISADSYLQVNFDTIALNHALLGGGIYKVPVTGNLDLTDSVVTNNMSDSDAQQANLSTDGLAPNSINCRDSLVYLNGPLWTAASLPFVNPGEVCEFVTADGLLEPLRGFGGPNNLPVHRPSLLSGGSHAIDKVITDTTPGTDQRDLAKPMDGKNLGGAKLIDRGSVELRPLQLETESLVVAAKSASDTHTTVNDGCSGSLSNCWFSNGSGTNLQANADGDFVTYQTSLGAGTYAVSVRYKKASNAGRFKVQWATSVTGTYSDIGTTTQEGYSTWPDWVTVSLGTITVTSGGTRFFKFLVTGKNASSSGRQLFPDYLDFVK